jgi:hypothetical protein
MKDRIVCGNKVDASFAQLSVTDLLDHEITSEAARRLHDDSPRAVALDPFEHEAGARVDRIGAAHGRVVELVHQLVTGTRRAKAAMASQ